jgi:hypothetical protein
MIDPEHGHLDDDYEDDDRPVFCPICEESGALSECETIDGCWACPAADCSYVWNPCSCESERMRITDRDRL